MAEGNKYPILHADEAAIQPIPQYLSLNYADLFKIQRIANPFPLRPVSFSRLTAYLECPGCALEQQRKRGKREPRHFTRYHQPSLFAANEPDPRLVGTLLHAVVDLLHETDGPLETHARALLLTEPDVLTRFVRYELLEKLREIGKIRLAMFFDEMLAREDTLRDTLLHPLINYQQELRRTGATIFSASERFQLKLLSTGNTFAGHRDWGGYVGIVGEFDQIRLHHSREGSRPAIMEFKKGLGKKKPWDRWLTLSEPPPPPRRSPLPVERKKRPESSREDLTEPGLAHALQLMIYWLAFQTRWDVMGRIMAARGQIDELPMSLHQDLDLILYNLHDSCQYRLIPTDLPTALNAVTNCIFYTNWAMKSGYALQASEHECGKTRLITDIPNPRIEVGFETISASTCYELARESLQRFSETVRWQKVPPPAFSALWS